MAKNRIAAFIAFLVSSSLGVAYFFAVQHFMIPKQDNRSPSSVKTSAEFERERLARATQIPSPFLGGKVRMRESELNRDSRLRALNPRGMGDRGQTRLPRGQRLSVLVDRECEKKGVSAASFRFPRPNAHGLKLEAVTIDLEAETNLAELDEIATRDECVRGISLEGKIRKSDAYDDPLSAGQNQLGAIGAKTAFPFFYASSLAPLTKVRIAIVDSGIDLSHPDLAPVLWRNSSGSSGYDFVNFDSDPRDDDGHGTHVAGLAAARGGNSIGISGVMPIGAELMAVKVLDENGDGSYSEVANGIRWATDNGAHVINLSLSGPGPSAIIEDALTYALSRGVFIATAAGNNNVRINESNNFTIPAAYGIRYTGLITVGAIDAITRSRSNFSNFGDYVEIAAPGSNGILSTLPGGIYDFLSGTSMSSPIVAGAAALAIGAFRSMGRPYTVAEIETAITNSATRNPNLNGLVRNSAELSLPRLTDSLKNDSLLSLEGGFRESAE